MTAAQFDKLMRKIGNTNLLLLLILILLAWKGHVL